MNKTHLEHSVIAVITQLILMIIVGIQFASVIVVTAFLMREVTQHEYKYAISKGWKWGDLLPIKGYEGFIYGWSKDSILDFVCPAICCLIVFALIT